MMEMEFEDMKKPVIARKRRSAFLRRMGEEKAWQALIPLAVVIVLVFLLIAKTVWIHYSVTGKFLP